MSLDDLATTHAQLKSAVSELYAARAALIRRARADGYTWDEIASALDMTRHGAVKASRMTALPRP